ncbi:MAG: hypothetical protein M3347_13775 [Armatimonadota bacterium]|nr:hypothetical protein [Armatimonadota bacterium]
MASEFAAQPSGSRLSAGGALLSPAPTIVQDGRTAPTVETAARDGGVTPRVIFFSLLLAVFFGYINPIIDAKLANTFLGAQHLPPGAVGVLIVVLLFINPATRLAARHAVFTSLLVAAGLLCGAFAWWRYSEGIDGPGVWTPAAIAALLLLCAAMGRRPLSRNETLVIYVTCLFSCLVPGHGAENFFVPNLMGPFYFATLENKWLDFLQAYTPQWLTPALWADPGNAYGPLGRELVNNWYNGGAAPVPWAAWMVPILVWCSLILALYVMLGCLGVMLRAQWAEHEALAFPLLRLPMELTEDLDRTDKYGTWSRFLHNPLTWIGFGMAVFIQTLNGLNFYFPDVPKITTVLDTGPLLSEPPWNQIGWTPIQIYPIAIGITYLLTSEVSFSLWFFFWLVRFQLIAAYYLGFMPNALPGSLGAGGKIFIGYQQVGVYLAYAAIVFWTGRAHYQHILRRAFGRAAMGDGERSEMVSYPTAFWGFVLSSLFLLAWSLAIGISLHVAVLMWILYLVLAIGLTRVVVEGGLLFVQQGWTALGTMAQLVTPTTGNWLSPNVLVPASYLQGAIMWDFRGFLLPSYVQGFKLAHDRHLSTRPLLGLLAVIMLITLAMGVLMRVKLGYDAGALGFHSWFAKSGAQLPARTTDTILKGVKDVHWMNWIWMGVGAALTYFLMLARSRFLWFPLHPIGYLVALGYAMHTLWFSIFAGWLFKVAITRYGGVDTYRKVTPAFLGLALGDVTMMLVWLIIDGWQGRTYHYLVPT